MMQRKIGRLLVCLCTAAMLVVPGMLPAAASCEEAVVACETNHDSTELEPMSVRRISTTIPLRYDNEGLSDAIYADLVPDAFEAPAVPMLALTFSEIATPNRALADSGIGETRIEGTLSLRVALEGVAGWYPISRWTDSTDVYAADRADGFPTHIAAGSVTSEGTTWKGQASVDGLPSFEVQWAPGSLPLSEENVRLTEDSDPYLTLTPALEGTTRYRTRYTPKGWVPGFDTFGDRPEDYPEQGLAIENTTIQSSWRKGWVKLNIDPDINRLDADSPDELPDLAFGEGHTLADLIDPQQTWPGTFWETDRTLITQTDNLDDGADGTVPAKGEVPGQGLVTAFPYQTAVTSFTPYAIVLPQGSSLTLANLDSAGTHNIASARQGADGLPLFQSDFVGLGAATEVDGVPDLTVGRYLFHCQAHSGMKGTLVIR